MISATTPRERVWQAIRHEQPDRVPWQVGCTVPARQKLEAHFGAIDLDTAVGNHLARYRPRPPDAFVEVRPGHWRDEFGVVWNRTLDKDIGMVEEYRLSTRSLNRLHLPNPRDPRRYAALPEFIATNATRFRYVSVAFSLFERAWSLRGMPDLMIDMLEAPSFVDELMDAILEFDLGILDAVLKYDIDGVLFGDDWGHQQGLLFGAKLWRRFIKPRVARLYEIVRRAGKAVMIHSCGKVEQLFPELIEIGLDVFNPFQPEVMDPVEIKRRFGSQLAFFGGMSVQRVLPFGTSDDVRREARRMIRDVGADGGLILAPSHDCPGDIPLENLLAFIDTMQSQ